MTPAQAPGVAFAGTPEFARVALAAILDAGFTVPVVLTQPDRPAGRGLKVQPSPVKQLAQARSIPVLQPRGLRLDGRYADDAAAARERLIRAAPDVLVVAAYGLILPPWVLELPRRGCVNIHGSLLPRWRGAAPIQRAIEAGDSETGITIMQMDAGLDTGPMLLALPLAITGDDTAATLHDRMARLGGEAIVDALRRIDTLRATPQPAAGVTYAGKIEKAEGAIDWALPAAAIARRVRAFDPFPGCSFVAAGETIKVWRVQPVAGGGTPGQVVVASDGRLVVACGEGALELLELQRPGGRRVAAADFLRGHPLAEGALLAVR